MRPHPVQIASAFSRNFIPKDSDRCNFLDSYFSSRRGRRDIRSDMNLSHKYATAIVILTAFMCKCSGSIEFPRDVRIMKRVALSLRSERIIQIETEEEKSKYIII